MNDYLPYVLWMSNRDKLQKQAVKPWNITKLVKRLWMVNNQFNKRKHLFWKDQIWQNQIEWHGVWRIEQKLKHVALNGSFIW